MLQHRPLKLQKLNGLSSPYSVLKAGGTALFSAKAGSNLRETCGISVYFVGGIKPSLLKSGYKFAYIKIEGAVRRTEGNLMLEAAVNRIQIFV